MHFSELDICKKYDIFLGKMHIIKSIFLSKFLISTKILENMHFSNPGNTQKICILHCKMHVFCKFWSLEKCILQETSIFEENVVICIFPGFKIYKNKMHIFCIFPRCQKCIF